jgi:coatomer subunit beta'
VLLIERQNWLTKTIHQVRVFKNFKERAGAGMKGSGSWGIEGLAGGALLSARGAGFVVFWDWESGEIVRRVEVESTNVRLAHLSS